MKNLSRRQLLNYASLLAASSLLKPPGYAHASESFTFHDYPFKLGIASGDPGTEGVVLWTRLAPNPYDLAALREKVIPVSWQVAEDERMKKVVQNGTNYSYPENAHSLHIEVQGLNADREYFYRFTAGGEQSPIGKTRTLPILGSHIKDFRFALASCQDISNGYFAAYRDMVEQEPKLTIHTGDYIYESIYRDGDRRIPVANAMTLEDYRHLHARYKLDPHLQQAHAASPWLMIWDDHEVENDWGADYSESIFDPEAFLKRKIAAIKAYYEHMPLRMSAKLRKNQARLYQRTVVGDLIEFNLLDCRQYRSRPPCLDEDDHAPLQLKNCEEALAQGRSLLGMQQERWLHRGFGHSGAKWNSLVQTTYMAPFDYLKGEGTAYKTDGWDGYAATRQRILDLIVEKGIKNPLAFGGEIHAYYAGVVNAKAYDFDSEPVLSEIVCTSLTSSGGGDERYKETMDLFTENPFARYFENRARGYVLCHVDHQYVSATLRKVSNVSDPDSSVSTLRKIVVEEGETNVLIN